MFNKVKNEFNREIKILAISNVNKKLKENGIERSEISSVQFDDLVKSEISILEADSKKVGAGVAIGIGLSIISGGIF